jgi:hypothetical protein
MALSNYTELQAAVRTEVNKTTSGIADAVIVDAITKCEAKLNRRLRLREMETLATATYNASDKTIESRQVAMPTGYIEMIDLRIKKLSQTDDNYDEVPYVPPQRIHEYYAYDTFWYTLRDQLEINRFTGGTDYELLMHYFKKWDIATDSTNWLLTNYPDVYLYGALIDADLHVQDKELLAEWRGMFKEGIKDLNELSKRGRDDAELSTREVSRMSNRGTFNILTGGYR